MCTQKDHEFHDNFQKWVSQSFFFFLHFLCQRLHVCILCFICIELTHVHTNTRASVFLDAWESQNKSRLQVSWVLAFTDFIRNCDLRLFISLADASLPCYAVFTWIFDAYTMSEVVILIYIFLTVRQSCHQFLTVCSTKRWRVTSRLTKWEVCAHTSPAPSYLQHWQKRPCT